MATKEKKVTIPPLEIRKKNTSRKSKTKCSDLEKWQNYRKNESNLSGSNSFRCPFQYFPASEISENEEGIENPDSSLHQLGFKIDAFLRGNDRGQVLEKLDSSEFEDWDSSLRVKVNNKRKVKGSSSTNPVKSPGDGVGRLKRQKSKTVMDPSDYKVNSLSYQSFSKYSETSDFERSFANLKISINPLQLLLTTKESRDKIDRYFENTKNYVSAHFVFGTRDITNPDSSRYKPFKNQYQTLPPNNPHNPPTSHHHPINLEFSTKNFTDLFQSPRHLNSNREHRSKRSSRDNSFATEGNSGLNSPENSRKEFLDSPSEKNKKTKKRKKALSQKMPASARPQLSTETTPTGTGIYRSVRSKRVSLEMNSKEDNQNDESTRKRSQSTTTPVRPTQ